MTLNDVKKFIKSPHPSKFKRALLQIESQAVSHLSERRIQFVSTKDALKWLDHVSTSVFTVDIVIGIPRSGMFLENYLAEKLGVAFSTPEFLSKSVFWDVPKTDGNEYAKSNRSFQHILLVDDTTYVGTALSDAKRLIQSKYPEAYITVAVLGASPLEHPEFVMIKNNVRLLCEWQLSTSSAGYTVACDIDGVLARADNKLLPLFRPKYVLDAVITDRLESEREATVEWLSLVGIRYKQLLMASDVKDWEFHKVHALRKLKPNFYIESDDKLAQQLWKATGIPILCYENMKFHS